MPLSCACSFQRVWVQNASVDVADLLATNGVLHILSQVQQERACGRPPRPATEKQQTNQPLVPHPRSCYLPELTCRVGKGCSSSWTWYPPSAFLGSFCR